MAVLPDTSTMETCYDTISAIVRKLRPERAKVLRQLAVDFQKSAKHIEDLEQQGVATGPTQFPAISTTEQTPLLFTKKNRNDPASLPLERIARLMDAALVRTLCSIMQDSFPREIRDMIYSFIISEDSKPPLLCIPMMGMGYRPGDTVTLCTQRLRYGMHPRLSSTPLPLPNLLSSRGHKVPCGHFEPAPDIVRLGDKTAHELGQAWAERAILIYRDCDQASTNILGGSWNLGCPVGHFLSTLILRISTSSSELKADLANVTKPLSAIQAALGSRTSRLTIIFHLRSSAYDRLMHNTFDEFRAWQLSYRLETRKHMRSRYELLVAEARPLIMSEIRLLGLERDERLGFKLRLGNHSIGDPVGDDGLDQRVDVPDGLPYIFQYASEEDLDATTP
ncbi:hypothetical protein CC86DRAFT_451910 [Ophiobolus disseminans]|uniref:Uncharacterized protein n=1 Tax=Ophiobolus disseminans TaxID=1469910 RepID=A0A6A7AI87_9PLEO|nr:hypothetical protein CC86DRAFT_451910 [Ophiobolus disseminans]